MRFLFLVFILYGALSVWAQVHTFLNVQAENDYVNWWGKGTDRFYTGGNFLSVDWIRSHKEIRLLGLELVQKTYTPSDLQTTQVEAMDHPYAGLLFMRHLIMVSPAQCKWNMLARISYGVSGPRSGVARFQKRLHQWIGDEVPQGWATMQPSYPFRQVDLSFNFPLQLSNRFSLGLFQLAEGGTFFNRWVGQGWLFWGDQPIPFFPGIDGLVPQHAVRLDGKKRIYTGLYVLVGLQYLVRDRIIEEAIYNKTFQTTSSGRFAFLHRTTLLCSGNFFVQYQHVALRVSQFWQASSITTLPAHYFGAIGFSFQL